MQVTKITASKFAEMHNVDSDWISAMGQTLIAAWEAGDAVKYSGYDGIILSHYHNGMFYVKLQSGITCVSHSEIQSVK